jgi:hypothetical protein
MAKVFISYSSKNRELVKALAEDIEALGHAVWFDKELTGGHVWWDSILQAILYCEVFIFALSPESLNSEACSREYTYAFTLRKTILPVLISGTVSPNLLPPELSLVQFVDYRQRDNSSALRLGRAFTALPVSQALPNPLPVPPSAPVAPILGLREQVDNPQMLSFEQQSALLIKLKTELKDPVSESDARELLQRFRKRRDLMAAIGDELDSLLTQRLSSSSRDSLAQNRSVPISSDVVQGIFYPDWKIIAGSILIWAVPLATIKWYVENYFFYVMVIPWVLQGTLISFLIYPEKIKSLFWYLRGALLGGVFAVFLLSHLKVWQIALGIILGIMTFLFFVSNSWYLIQDIPGFTTTVYNAAGNPREEISTLGELTIGLLIGGTSAYIFNIFYNISKQQALNEA